jgi:hypothetical protein
MVRIIFNPTATNGNRGEAVNRGSGESANSHVKLGA